MKKTAIIASILSLFAFVGAANAQTPTKLTPRQKIAAMRLAKMKKKPVVIATGSVNSGNAATGASTSCPYSIMEIKLSGFNDTPKENYIYIRDMLSSIESTLIKMDMYPVECGQVRSDTAKVYAANKQNLTKIMNDNAIAWNDNIFDSIDSLQLGIDAILFDYNNIYNNWGQCLIENVNGQSLYGYKYKKKDCGNSPDDVMEQKKVQIYEMKKQLIHY